MNAESKLTASVASALPLRRKARGRRFALMLAVPAALLLTGGYFWLNGGRYAETQDANAHQARVPIAANVSGMVTQIGFRNDHRVQKGQLLFQVDPRPFALAVEQAQAAVSQARLQVEQLKAGYASAVTQVKVNQDQVKFYDSELARQEALAARGAATQESLDQARNADVVAKGQLATAEQAVLSAKAALDGDPEIAIDQHPNVRAALAALDTAKFNLAQARVVAPADGIVYLADNFRPGQFVTAGSAVFTLVETQHVWVEADFKETQLAHVKPGQQAAVTFDLYPGRRFPGVVESIGAGTGAEFALLPAENATGNWVKVTQRIPVYIQLDDPPADLPLHSGMSAAVSVDTGITRHLSELVPAALQ